MLSTKKLKYIYIDHISLSVILYIIPLYLYYIKQYYLLFILGFFSSIASFLYHITYEQSTFYLYLDMTFSYISSFLLLYDILFYTFDLIEFYTYITLLTLACISYILGIGRDKSIERTQYYNIFHFIWHFLIFILTFSHSYFK
jgi:hypothetical protein